MSRKSPTDQMADDLGCLIIGLLWLAIVGFFTLLFKSTQVSPEDQLLKLQPSYAWLWRIESKNCPQCGATNESYIQRCYQCGMVFATPTKSAEQKTISNSSSVTQPSAPESNIALNMVIFVMVIIGVFILISVLASLGQ